MSATALTLATVLALAANPQCGAAPAGSEFASRLVTGANPRAKTNRLPIYITKRTKKAA
jgi:hypothetical protein